jgi:hypothetical protein
MVDDAPAFELSFWCGTCQFLFQRLEGATATFSLDDGNGLADALGGIDEEVVSQFGVLLPEDRALYDLPDAPRPGPSGKAPVRLSP